MGDARAFAPVVMFGKHTATCLGTGGSLVFLRPDRVVRSSSAFERLPIRADIDHGSDQVPEEHSVDALALRGEEGRGTLR